MDAQLLGKLTRAEEDIVSAVLTGDGDLAAYDFVWSSLLDEISQASASGNINDATLSVADGLVARVATLVECYLSLSSTSPPSFPTLDLNTDSPPPSSFIPEAHAWLLKNIANPYPSAEFKASLAQRHNSQVSAISSWFTNARRRIGWTTLCRDFFPNCRADAVGAAHRVLVKKDPDHRLGPEVIHALVAMKVAAEELCRSFMQSTLTGDSNAVVKNLLTNDKLLPSDASGKTGCPEPEVLNEHTGESWTCTRERVIPRKSPTTQLNLDLPHASCFGDSVTRDEEDTLPLLLAGSKRRSLPLESVHIANSKALSELVKSPRASCRSNIIQYSPSTSAEDSPENDLFSHSIRGTQSSVYAINSRKRRLSDSHHTEMSKRSRHSMCLHTLPDPSLSLVESEQTIDEWFKANFDSLFTPPPLAEVTEPDYSTKWEVDLFNNYTLPESAQEVVATPFPDYGTSLSTDLAALDDHLQFFPSDGYVASPQVICPAQSTPVACTVSHSPQILPDPLHSIDWTALFNGSTGDPIFSGSLFDSALPDIDFSVLQIPQAWGAVVS